MVDLLHSGHKPVADHLFQRLRVVLENKSLMTQINLIVSQMIRVLFCVLQTSGNTHPFVLREKSRHCVLSTIDAVLNRFVRKLFAGINLFVFVVRITLVVKIGHFCVSQLVFPWLRW